MAAKLRWMTGAVVSAALLVGSAGTAQARPRWDRWDHGRYRDRGGFGFGDALGVAALVGAAAIVATSVSKDRKAARGYQEQDAPPPQDGTDYGADVRSGERPHDADFSDVAGSAAHDDRLTDACAMAARDEAEGREGGYAEVRHIDAPVATQDGYNIDGEVETRTSYSATEGSTRRFTCAMKDGRVAEVYFARDVASR